MTSETVTQHTLISPLGLSPGAVSGAAFGLSRAPAAFPISRVVTVSTSHAEVRQAAAYLRSVLDDAGLAYVDNFIPQPELKESDDSVATFVARLGAVLSEAAQAGDVIHVAVTGGRAGMGALAALAASLYGADHLWHLWVPVDIERGGRVGELQKPFTRENRYLNPPDLELVPLPFLDLRPFHPALWRYYHGETETDLAAETRLGAALTPFLSGQLQLADVFPGGVTTRQKREVEAIAAAHPDAGGDLSQAGQQELAAILHQGGQIDEATRRALEDFMALGDSAFDLLERVPGETGSFWQYLHARSAQIAYIVQAGGRQISRSRVRRRLADNFTLQELRNLAADLGVNYERLGAGLGTADFARELLRHVQNRGRLAELVGHAAVRRPHLDWWPEADKAPPTPGEELIALTESDLFLLHGLVAWLHYRDHGRPF
jgi:hypothetical protein